MSQSIARHREFHWHKRFVLPVKELQLASIEFSLFIFKFVQHTGFHNSRQKIMEHHVLIMETHELLYVLKFRIGLVVHRAIVKTMKKPLELRDDGVLVVAWITNQRTGGIRAITRQICRPYLRLSRVDGFPQ